ncbi:DUF4403 family protein [Aquiflexum sp. TKW24L]|uniref:DUF4403 family protein n=1 Tax=Aquiflexum sp. TKW24L TaxID=2942212 RepID=UPI0020BE6EE1|nr:DUF4403 family protein [Aquiflexum sp. TKW24L]MCL6259006.1 DUF4403 family protein [Aquiflexum sp. TKW24L]
MFSKYTLPVFFILFVFSSCKSIKPNNPPFSSVTELPQAISKANIPIEIPLSYIEDNLNNTRNSKLFSEKGLELGSGLFADLDVTRIGKISITALENNTIRVKLPMNLVGDMKIEKRVFGQNLSTNFPFNENLSPEISFIPEIGKNWDLSIKNLQIDNWGRSMKYNLLGFEIDLDKVVKSQLQKVLDNQLAAADLSQLDFKNIAQETWDVFSEPYTIEQEGMEVHFYTIPNKLKVKEKITQDQKLVLYLGIEGEMFSKIGAKPIIPKSPLPNIEPNENRENEIELVLPLILRYEDLDGYLNNEMAGKAIKIDGKTEMVPTNLKTQKYGDKTLLSMDFTGIRKGKKDIKGKMYFAGKPVFDAATESLRFDEAEFDVKSDNGMANIGIRLKKRKIMNQIKKLANYPVGDFLSEARKEMEKQGKFETGFGTFQVINPTLDVEGIYSTEEDVRIYLKSTGKMEVRLKDFK